MSGMKRNVVLALAVAAAVAAPSAFATNGYFSHGYGMKAQGMGGAVWHAEDYFRWRLIRPVWPWSEIVWTWV